ncbi:MAG TPA: hypothetical protein VM031_00845 [Phycisphaerae bacterium]|nr:hypothetical protein [Phycisphaerae bacterium]
MLVLRADAIGDVVAGRVPGLSIYQDGTVLLRGDPGPVVARLTPEGLSTLMEETIASPAVSGGDIGPAPDYAAGFTWYFIAIRDLDRLIERSVANAAPADRKAEADAVIALVDRLLGLETWLPEAAWVVAPAVAEPWVPARYLLKVTDWGYTGDLALPVDLIDIEWPLAEALLAFGEPFDIGSSPDDVGAPGSAVVAW